MNPVSDYVVMTDADLRRACEIASARQIENTRKGRANARGLDTNGSRWQELLLHLQGAIGEVGFAAMHGLQASKGTLGAFADVGLVEVKAIIDPAHRLVLRLDTPADTLCALMYVARVPHVVLVGWCVARDVMIDKWRGDLKGRGQTFNVPEQALTRGLVPRSRLIREEVW